MIYPVWKTGGSKERLAHSIQKLSFIALVSVLRKLFPESGGPPGISVARDINIIIVIIMCRWLFMPEY
jgi:hypothetical protein